MNVDKVVWALAITNGILGVIGVFAFRILRELQALTDNVMDYHDWDREEWDKVHSAKGETQLPKR